MASTRLAAAVLLIGAAVPVQAQTGDRCEHEATRSATVQAKSGARLHADAGSGSLRVNGREGLTEVRVRGRACASSEALLRELTIAASEAGGSVRVEARYPEARERSRDDGYAYIDLVVEVPPGMAATIDDGSGPAVLEGLGALEVEDGSGDLSIHDIRGEVRVDDGSGDVTIERVTGDVIVDDGSGDVVIDDVRGGVLLEDGSGLLEVRNVTASVRVRDDGSGSIRVAEIGGDFVVDSDGSGSIRHDRVRGRVRLPDDD